MTKRERARVRLQDDIKLLLEDRVTLLPRVRVRCNNLLDRG